MGTNNSCNYSLYGLVLTVLFHFGIWVIWWIMMSKCFANVSIKGAHSCLQIYNWKDNRVTQFTFSWEIVLKNKQLLLLCGAFHVFIPKNGRFHDVVSYVSRSCLNDSKWHVSQIHVGKKDNFKITTGIANTISCQFSTISHFHTWKSSISRISRKTNCPPRHRIKYKSINLNGCVKLTILHAMPILCFNHIYTEMF